VRPTDLRGILHYVPQFRDRTFVIAVDGAIVTDDNFGNILKDIAVLWSLRIRVVLAHGASAQIRALAAQRGVTPSDLDGAGVTDATTLDLALHASSRLTHEILEGLSVNDLRAASTNAVLAHPCGILRGIDHQLTGRVERIDVELLEGLLQSDVVPVVPPLGFDGEGHTYRLNSDAVALELGKALGAVKLVFITTVDGLFVDGKLMRQVQVGDLAEAVERGTVASEIGSKARHAVAACNAGIERVHIINGHVEEGLLAEVFSNEGIGTLIHANEYRQIRPARRRDVPSIQSLIGASVESEELVPRSRAVIEEQIDDYYIYEIDENPVACIALHLYPEEGKGELACLLVRPTHENQGIGRRMIQFVESRARELGLSQLFALSTQTFSYFHQKAGYSEARPEDLPAARLERYDESGRRSKVLTKSLGPRGDGGARSTPR
jgi:amino-acid N-acetyltransferase